MVILHLKKENHVLKNLNWIMFAFLYLSFDVGVEEADFWLTIFFHSWPVWCVEPVMRSRISEKTHSVVGFKFRGILFECFGGFWRRTLNTHFCVLNFHRIYKRHNKHWHPLQNSVLWPCYYVSMPWWCSIFHGCIICN